MNSYQEEINNLLLNPGFRNWALKSNLDDYQEWENAVKSDDRFAAIAHEARKIIVEIELSESNPDSRDQESLRRLELKKDRHKIETATYGTFQVKTPTAPYVRFSRIAAVILFFMVFLGVLYFNSQWNSADPTDNPVMVQKQTQNGQQMTITLPDGSRVKLNSNSSISFPKEFFTNRHVDLKGEAFFTVVRDESNPFIVTTSKFRTRVLGTSFNVNAYESGVGKVSVAEGKVLVSATDEAETLGRTVIEKAQAVEISGNELTLSQFDEDELLWKEGILVFADESIHTIARKIERWFNVKVVVENQGNIAGEFSGKYSNESLEEILKGMGYALNFSFEMEGNEVLIKGNN
jgi:ferric-dicitrate binding protein FerR (iron transport regulator)